MSGPGRGTTQRGRMLAPRGRSPAGAGMTFQLLDTEAGNLSGVVNLNPLLTINGVGVTPTFVYHGGDATTSSWPAATYGETLTAAGSGGSVNQGSPYLGSDDDSVNPDGTRYWQASGNSFADVTTEDMVFECVVKWKPTVTARFLYKRIAVGWMIAESGGGVNYYLQDAGGGTATTSAALTTGAWYHVLVFADRSGSAQWYVNGVASGAAVSIASRSGTLSVATSLDVAAQGAANNYDSNIAYLAMWKRDNWLDTHLQADVAQERFQRLVGLYPQIAKGTALWTDFTRATTATLDKVEYGDEYERKLYTVGAGWPRVCYRQEATSGADFVGYLAETAATNLCAYSSDFEAATTYWANIRLTVAADSVVAPDGTQTADTLVEDGTPASSHYASIAFTQAASTAYVFSVWAKAANRDWIRLLMTSGTDGAARVDFGLLTGTVGTEMNNDSAGIEDWGNGWFRCWMRDTRTTAEGAQVSVFVAEADNDVTYDGLSQDSLYVWGAQIEADVDYPTSYIPTSGGTATRNADVLYFVGDDGNVVNNQQGTVEVDVLLPDVDNTVAPQLMGLTDGGSNNDRIQIYATTGDAAAALGVESGGVQWNFGGSADVFDGDKHTIRQTWKINSAILYVDESSEGTPDTSCTPPDDLDRIHIGMSASAAQPNGLTRNIKILPAPKTP